MHTIEIKRTAMVRDFAFFAMMAATQRDDQSMVVMQ